jgi:integrase
MRTDQFPKPFWRAARQAWYVQIGGRQIKLHTDRDEAFRLYHELMSSTPKETEAPPRLTAPAAVEIIDLFLDWTEKNRERLTYEAYRRRLQVFVDSIPASLPYSDLKPHDVTRVMDANAAKWNANTKNDFATAVQRAFNWAQAEGLITHNPLARVRKPGREARELAISPAQYVEIIQAVTETNFRTLLELAWETGARPQEIIRIEVRHVDMERRRVIFPPREAKGKQRYRVIYLGTDRRWRSCASNARSIRTGRSSATPKANRGRRTRSIAPSAA